MRANTDETRSNLTSARCAALPWNSHYDIPLSSTVEYRRDRLSSPLAHLLPPLAVRPSSPHPGLTSPSPELLLPLTAFPMHAPKGSIDGSSPYGSELRTRSATSRSKMAQLANTRPAISVNLQGDRGFEPQSPEGSFSK